VRGKSANAPDDGATRSVFGRGTAAITTCGGTPPKERNRTQIERILNNDGAKPQVRALKRTLVGTLNKNRIGRNEQEHRIADAPAEIIRRWLHNRRKRAR